MVQVEVKGMHYISAGDLTRIGLQVCVRMLSVPPHLEAGAGSSASRLTGTLRSHHLRLCNVM